MVQHGGTIQFSTCMIWKKHTFGGANARNAKVLGYCNGPTNAKTHVSSNVTQRLDGRILPCEFDGNLKFNTGNVQNHSSNLSLFEQ